MSEFYDFIPMGGYELCLPLERPDLLIVHDTFAEEPLVGWKPIKAAVCSPYLTGRPGRRAEAPYWHSSVLVLRQASLPVLSPLLEKHGELLPLECADEPLWIYHCTTFIDALDAARSTFTVFGPTKVVATTHLLEERLVGIDAFRLAGRETAALFVSGAFVAAFGKAGFKGLKFRRRWPH